MGLILNIQPFRYKQDLFAYNSQVQSVLTNSLVEVSLSLWGKLQYILLYRSLNHLILIFAMSRINSCANNEFLWLPSGNPGWSLAFNPGLAGCACLHDHTKVIVINNHVIVYISQIHHHVNHTEKGVWKPWLNQSQKDELLKFWEGNLNVLLLWNTWLGREVSRKISRKRQGLFTSYSDAFGGEDTNKLVIRD